MAEIEEDGEEALLRSLLAEQGFSFEAEERIPPAGDAPVEASFAQSRLWFLNQMQPDDWSYNLAAAFSLDEEPDRERVTRSFAEVIARHETLRTRIQARQGRPFQILSTGEAVALEAIDVSPLSEAPADEVAEVLKREVRRTFDLATDLPFRLTLIRTGDGTGVLLIVIHHVATDGWSLRLIARDFVKAYAGQRVDTRTPASVRYRDFAAWERSRWTDGSMADALRYWKSRLDDLPPSLDFPFDKPRSSRPSSKARLASTDVAHAVVNDTARRLASTPYIVLLTAYAAVLSLYTGAEDIVVGATTAGRTRPELEDVVGLFANTVAHRFQIERGETLASHVRRFTPEVFGDLDHQDVPFDKIVQQAMLDRRRDASPLFEAAFVLQNFQDHASEMLSSGLTQLPIPIVSTRFDLSLVVEMSQASYVVKLYYRDGSMTDVLADQFCRRLKRTLMALADGEDLPLGQVRTSAVDERSSLLVRSTGAPAGFDSDRTVYDIVVERARMKPDEIAVTADGRDHSYEQLLTRVASIGDGLRQRGVTAGSVVALLLPRSFEAVAAMMGILSIGASFLPLDPDYPVARLSFMEEDSGALLTVTDAPTLRSTAWTPVEALVLDELGTGEVEDPFQRGAGSPGDPIYTMYTSGSTGRPKATVNLNRGIVNFIFGIQQQHPLSSTDSVLHKAALIFDVSAWEIFWPLMTGCRVVIAPSGSQSDPSQLCRLIDAERITVAHFVPPMLAVFLDAADASSCSSLRLVFAGGEALPSALVERFHRRSNATLINSYGPTETSIGVTSWECPRDGFDSVIPIGRPMPDVRLYILDASLEPVPDGVPGQLFIAGRCVGGGYLNRPELTRERFIAEPGHPGSLMYASGDLVRRRADDTIVFLGRQDHQVKLRGQRVEIGEVETALRRLSGIGEVLVVADGAGLQGSRLLAYVCAREPGPWDERAIRQTLERDLPRIMIPERIMLIERMPLTQNGKVDRRKLPIPSEAKEVDSKRATFSPAEAMVADAFEKTLGVRPSQGDASFFEMGGHSLLAIQLLFLVQERTGTKVRLSRFMQNPTLAGLASCVGNLTPPTPEALHFFRRGRGCLNLILVHPALGFTKCYTDLVSSSPDDWTIVGIEDIGTFGESSTIEERALSYVGKLDALALTGDIVLGGWSSGGLVAFEMSRLMSETGRPAALTVLIDSHLHLADSFSDALAGYRPWIGFFKAAGIDTEVLKTFPIEAFVSGDLGSRIDNVAEILERSGFASTDTIKSMASTYHSNARAAFRYRPKRSAQPTMLFVASQHSETTQMEAAWASVASDLQVVEVDANHETIMKLEHARGLMEAIDRRSKMMASIAARPPDAPECTVGVVRQSPSERFSGVE